MGISSPEPELLMQYKSHDTAASSITSDSDDDRPIVGLGHKPRIDIADSAAAGSCLQQHTEAAILQSCEGCQDTPGILGPDQQMGTSEGISDRDFRDEVAAAASASADLEQEGLWAEQCTDRGEELSALDAASGAEVAAWPSPQQLPEEERGSLLMRLASSPSYRAELSGAQQPYPIVLLPSHDMRVSAEAGVAVPDKAQHPGSCILLRASAEGQVQAEAGEAHITDKQSDAQQMLPAVIPDR